MTPASRRAALELSIRLMTDPEDAFEIRGLGCWGKYPQYQVFLPGQYEEGAEFAYYLSETGPHDSYLREIAHADYRPNQEDPLALGTYITLNPVKVEVFDHQWQRAWDKARGLQTDASTIRDGDIARRRWLLVDADPTRPADTNSTDAEKSAALETTGRVREYLTGRGWSAPALCDSGNGYHLLYPLDQPASDGGLVGRVLAALDAKFTTPAVKIDTKVFNPARITKLYGTFTRKGDNTPDRPHRYSRLLELSEAGVVTTGRLEAVAAEVPAEVGEEIKTRTETTKPAEPPADLEFFVPHTAKQRNRIMDFVAAFPPAISGQGGHLVTYRMARALVRGFNLSVEVALKYMLVWNRHRCKPPWSEAEIRHKLEDANNYNRSRGQLWGVPREYWDVWMDD
jgi:hypothetical protein